MILYISLCCLPMLNPFVFMLREEKIDCIITKKMLLLKKVRADMNLDWLINKK